MPDRARRERRATRVMLAQMPCAGVLARAGRYLAIGSFSLACGYLRALYLTLVDILSDDIGQYALRLKGKCHVAVFRNFDTRC
jgi:hypothetical protein